MIGIDHDSWQRLADQLAPQYPSVGKTVRVTEGKHKGKVGQVTWHGENRYYDKHYKTDAQLWLMDLTGRAGFRVCVQTPTEKFFVDADKVEVIQQQEEAR